MLWQDEACAPEPRAISTSAENMIHGMDACDAQQHVYLPGAACRFVSVPLSFASPAPAPAWDSTCMGLFLPAAAGSLTSWSERERGIATASSAMPARNTRRSSGSDHVLPYL